MNLAFSFPLSLPFNLENFPGRLLLFVVKYEEKDNILLNFFALYR